MGSDSGEVSCCSKHSPLWGDGVEPLVDPACDSENVPSAVNGGVGRVAAAADGDKVLVMSIRALAGAGSIASMSCQFNGQD
jgi:hypothetical protein